MRKRSVKQLKKRVFFLRTKIGWNLSKVSTYLTINRCILLYGKDLDQFRRENTDMLDDKLQAVAEEFCMDAEDILGYVLEYRLEIF